MTRNLRGATLLLLGSSLLACSGSRPEPASRTATKAAPAPVAEPAPAASPAEEIGRIEAEVARIDSMRKSPARRLELYARATEKGPLVPVKDTLSWPEQVDASFSVLRDDSGRVRFLSEIPFSESGDWDNEYTHYFDEQGRLIEFERYSGFFNGCPHGLAKETTRHFYAPSSQLLKETYELKDRDGAPIDSSSCEFAYRFPYAIHPTWSAAAKALGLPGDRGVEQQR